MQMSSLVNTAHLMVQTAKELNDAQVFGDDKELAFCFDRRRQRFVMQLQDRRTHKTISQVSTKQACEIARKLRRQRTIAYPVGRLDKTGVMSHLKVQPQRELELAGSSC